VDQIHVVYIKTVTSCTCHYKLHVCALDKYKSCVWIQIL